MTEGRVSSCPHCGVEVAVIDGVFDVHRAVGGSPCYGSRQPVEGRVCSCGSGYPSDTCPTSAEHRVTPGRVSSSDYFDTMRGLSSDPAEVDAAEQTHEAGRVSSPHDENWYAQRTWGAT